MALVGAHITGVQGSADAGYIVTYRDPIMGVCRALVPPSLQHPDFIAAQRWKNGIRPQAVSNADDVVWG